MVAYFSVALVVIIYHTTLYFFINRHWLFWYYFSSLVNIVINNALVFSHWAIGRITMQRGRQNVTFFFTSSSSGFGWDSLTVLSSVQFWCRQPCPVRAGRWLKLPMTTLLSLSSLHNTTISRCPTTQEPSNSTKFQRSVEHSPHIFAEATMHSNIQYA